VAKLRVHNFAVSVDGYAAGPGQNINHPLGVGGERPHEWVFKTQLGRARIGAEGVKLASTTTSSPPASQG